MGEPTIVFVISFILLNVLQKPKSATLSILSLKRILEGLRSLCKILSLMRDLKAFNI